MEEPTMILMFGDHQPQVATNFYTEVLGGAFDTLTPGPPERQKVPFVLWANYDIPEEQGTELSRITLLPAVGRRACPGPDTSSS